MKEHAPALTSDRSLWTLSRPAHTSCDSDGRALGEIYAPALLCHRPRLSRGLARSGQGGTVPRPWCCTLLPIHLRGGPGSKCWQISTAPESPSGSPARWVGRRSGHGAGQGGGHRSQLRQRWSLAWISVDEGRFSWWKLFSNCLRSIRRAHKVDSRCHQGNRLNLSEYFL